MDSVVTKRTEAEMVKFAICTAVEAALLNQLAKVGVHTVYVRSLKWTEELKCSLECDIAPPNHLSGRKGTPAQREQFEKTLNETTFKARGMKFNVKIMRKLVTFCSTSTNIKKDMYYNVQCGSM
ncbi:Tenellin synthetase [Frankliniella fusca]|uniref:Tenellin synthetase n=1 Tax=Frankliniella fusca TaxID=407009 RepID=A0AAE1HEQ0_9NEOP|nr:Tenellin synthetase [Frankliniella fusca]